jgi:hypothetical protein
MIAKSDRLTLSIIILLVECSHALSAVSVDLNRSIVDFAHSLKLDIITPNSIATFTLAVKFDILISDKDLKIILSRLYVLHAFLPHLLMVV